VHVADDTDDATRVGTRGPYPGYRDDDVLGGEAGVDTDCVAGVDPGAARQLEDASAPCVANALITASRAANAWRSAIGWNSRRRTISKPSSALAGRHEFSTRPKVFLSRSSATSPPSPPISMRDCGRAATNSAPGVALTASVTPGRR
jgi:hypothetical protein